MKRYIHIEGYIVNSSAVSLHKLSLNRNNYNQIANFETVISLY
jgi:hypothetical protein